MAVEATPQATDQEVKAVDNKGEKSSPPEHIPYDRFNKVIKERNDAADRITQLNAQLEGYKQEKQQEFDRDLERKGEFEILATKYKEENTTLRNEMDSVKEYKLEQRSLLTGRLPENKRDFANSMDLVDLAKFVDIEEKSRIQPREDAAPGKRFGGYDNIVEFASKDPVGYKAAKDAGQLKTWRK